MQTYRFHGRTSDIKGTDKLWKQYFRDTSLWWDNRNVKSNLRSADFRHRTTSELLWTDRCDNPPWILEQLKAQGAIRLFRHEEMRKDIGDDEPSKDTRKEISTSVASLKSCIWKKDLCAGSRIHDELAQSGLLEKSPCLSSILIHMYAKCGMLGKAQQVLDELSVRDVVHWSALISGYAHDGQGGNALECYRKMQNEGLSPDVVTYTCVLKACGDMRAIEDGKELHYEIVRRGLLRKDIILGNSLVDMYAKCGVLRRAQQVLEELPARNAASWNVLIAGHAQEAQDHEALSCYECLQMEGVLPDGVTFICVLSVCSRKRSIDKGKQIHEEVVRRGLDKQDVALGNALVVMYSRCEALSRAQEVLETLPFRNTISWNAIIAGYAQWGLVKEVWQFLGKMERDSVAPDAVTFIYSLQACGNAGAIDEGREIHDMILRKGFFGTNIILGNTLVNMYAKCGLLGEAYKILKALHLRDVTSWNIIIAACAEQEQEHEGLSCLEEMQNEGHKPDCVTYLCVLKACASTRAIDKGKQIHEEIMTRGMLEKYLVLGNALVDMYAKCGELAKAHQVHQGLHDRDVISWNALIAGYAQHGSLDEALNFLKQMQTEGIYPDVVTFICVLKACGNICSTDKVKMVHESIVNKGLLGKDIVLDTALVDAYAKCGMLVKAHQILKQLPVRNAITWSTLIAGYARHGQGGDALNCFEQMQSEGFAPDAVTFISILDACNMSNSISVGEKIHEVIKTKGFLNKEMKLCNALVSMYAKMGMLTQAQEVLEELLVRDVVTWNAVISGYAENGQDHEAFVCFELMQREGLIPDVITFINILKVCGFAGAVDKGIQIHKEIKDRGLLGKDIILSNALVDMYARCTQLLIAHEVVEELHLRDVVSWNILIAGYAQEGQGQKALNCFQRMQSEAVPPDEVTFTCILSACSHSGLMDDAQTIFGNMVTMYGIPPTLEHHVCMIIGFGCSGLFHKAMSIIDVMPSYEYPPVWLALIAACKKWNNLELATLAFHQLLQLDNGAATAYVLMAEIYAAAGMIKDAEKVYLISNNYDTYKVANLTDLSSDEVLHNSDSLNQKSMKLN